MLGREQIQGSGSNGLKWRNQHLAVAFVTNLSEVWSHHKRSVFRSRSFYLTLYKNMEQTSFTLLALLENTGCAKLPLNANIYSGTKYGIEDFADGKVKQPTYILLLPLGYDVECLFPRCHPPPHFLLPISHLQDLLGNWLARVSQKTRSRMRSTRWGSRQA